MNANLSTTEILKKPALRAAWVEYQLKLRGLSLAELGRRNGLGRRTVAYALYRPNEKLEVVIAEALGMTAEALFPERFENGRRLHVTRRRKTTSVSASRNDKAARAA